MRTPRVVAAEEAAFSHGERLSSADRVRVVVVDDHDVVRTGVQRMLSDQPGIQCVGTVSAIADLRDSGYQYDACVLDLMGVGTAQEATDLFEEVPVVVFTQADQWRVRAGAWLCGARAVLGKEDNAGPQLADAVWDAVHAPHLLKPQLAGALLDMIEQCRIDALPELVDVLVAVRRGRRVRRVLADTGLAEEEYARDLERLRDVGRGLGLGVLAIEMPSDQRSDGSSAPPLDSPAFAYLSPRQREILDLLADGFSQQEVSEKLFLAPRTVTNHMRAALERFGIRRHLSQDVWIIFALYVTGRHARPETLLRRLHDLRDR